MEAQLLSLSEQHRGAPFHATRVSGARGLPCWRFREIVLWQAIKKISNNQTNQQPHK
jgi:hypothetical protein